MKMLCEKYQHKHQENAYVWQKRKEAEYKSLKKNIKKMGVGGGEERRESWEEGGSCINIGFCF